MTDFPQNLARTRRQNGLTQDALARRMNLSFQAISKWETGQSMPDLEQLTRLADLFGLSTDALLGHVPAPDDGAYRLRYDQERYYWGVAPSSMCYEVMRLRPPVRPLRVLDVGCGEGKDAVFFARNGYEVCAFDRVEAGLEKGRRLARACGAKVRFFQADARTFRPSEEYDIVFSSGVLHCLPPESRREILESYQARTPSGGLHALNAFVEKPFLPAAPDAEPDAVLWRSGELAGLYADWRFHRCSEEIFDCDSGGVPHRHCMDALIAEKP